VKLKESVSSAAKLGSKQLPQASWMKVPPQIPAQSMKVTHEPSSVVAKGS
jgi:hypothetical protein